MKRNRHVKTAVMLTQNHHKDHIFFRAIGPLTLQYTDSTYHFAWHGLMNNFCSCITWPRKRHQKFNFPGSYPCDLEAHRLHRPETSHYGLALSPLMRQFCTYLTGNPSPSTPWSWTSGPEAFFGAIGVVNSTPEVLYYLIYCHFCTPGDLNRSDSSSTHPICRSAN